MRPCPSSIPPIPSCTAPRPPAAQRLEHGQATLEFVGVLPILALALAACVQALLLGLTLVFAQASVDAVARQGRAIPAQELPVPSAWRRGARVSMVGGRAQVVLAAPVVVPGVPRRLVRLHAEAGS